MRRVASNGMGHKRSTSCNLSTRVLGLGMACLARNSINTQEIPRDVKHQDTRKYRKKTAHLWREHPDGLYPKDEVVSDARKRDLFAPPRLPDALATHGTISWASHLLFQTREREYRARRPRKKKQVVAALARRNGCVVEGTTHNPNVQSSQLVVGLAPCATKNQQPHLRGLFSATNGRK